MKLGIIHYKYKKKDISYIRLYAKKLDAKILTTEKDFVKINNRDSKGIKFLEVKMEIKQKKKLIQFIEKIYMKIIKYFFQFLIIIFFFIIFKIIG